MQVSFVIPAFNEEKYIGGTITAIRDATVDLGLQDTCEVIVADDGSEDETAKLARQSQARVVVSNRQNIAAARNVGAAAARGELLIFVDADTLANAPLIGEVVAAWDAGATWGTARLVPAEDCPGWARLGLHAFNAYYVGLRRCAFGSFFFVTRDAFATAGGFPENTPEGEDMALSKKLAKSHGPLTVVRSKVATSVRKIHRFGFRYHLKMLWLAACHGDQMRSHPQVVEYWDGHQRLANVSRCSGSSEALRDPHDENDDN